MVGEGYFNAHKQKNIVEQRFKWGDTIENVKTVYSIHLSPTTTMLYFTLIEDFFCLIFLSTLYL